MQRRHLLCFTLPLLLFALGCEGDPTVDDPEPETPVITGNWVLVTTDAPGKAPCAATALGDTRVEEVSITQDGADLVLVFADYAASGVLSGNTIDASGVLPGGETIEFALTLVSSRLEGPVLVTGQGCGSERLGSLTRRADDRNFSGHWFFDLDVVGEGGCAHLQDYLDCFRIYQDGTDLLVVDEEAGNLFGRVVGDVAEIVRDQPGETTSLVFFMDPAGDRVSGRAIRVYSELECRTDLIFVGTIRDQPCANMKHR